MNHLHQLKAKLDGIIEFRWKMNDHEPIEVQRARRLDYIKRRQQEIASERSKQTGRTVDPSEVKIMV